MTLIIQDIRALIFFIALFLYGAFGSPTPDQIGWVELTIFSLLIMTLNFSLLKNLTSKSQLVWVKISFWLILYAAIIPTVIALTKVTNGNEFIRDLIALAFITLPFFLLPFLKDSLPRQKAFIYGVFTIAILFMARTLFTYYVDGGTTDFKLLYLANSPLILWGVLFVILRGAGDLPQLSRLHNMPRLIGVLLIIALGVASMAVDTQRAFLFATAITIVTAVLVIFTRSPIKAIIIFLGLMALYVFTPHGLNDLIHSVMSKTQLVGFNRRLDEWQAVWEILIQDPITLFFGIGWGQGFASPAVAHIHVTYTHNLLSFMLLKTGLIGFSLTFVYVACFIIEIWKKYMGQGSIALAYFWPLIIPILLYASYKSFDFGLLLTLILMTELSQKSKSTSL